MSRRSRGGSVDIQQPFGSASADHLKTRTHLTLRSLGHARPQSPSLAEIDRSAECVRQIELQAAERQQGRLRVRCEFDQQIDVTVRPRVTPHCARFGFPAPGDRVGDRVRDSN